MRTLGSCAAEQQLTLGRLRGKRIQDAWRAPRRGDRGHAQTTKGRDHQLLESHMTMLDRAGLEQLTCERYALVKNEYDRLLPVTQT
jgi:hypothetical protein